MTRRPATTGFWMSRLPHWEVEDGRYFVTLHLAGAIPAIGRDRLRAQIAELRNVQELPPSETLRIHRLIFAEMERWLDRAEWNPLLNLPELAKMVVEAIDHRTNRGDWRMFEFVVMPTHLHLFCEACRGSLREMMDDFKRWAGHQAAVISPTSIHRFWQREWFDHWSRSDEEDEKIAAYIRNNPVKAGLVADYRTYPYGSWSK